MKAVYAGLVAAAALLVTGTAQAAEVVDLSTITCADFSKRPKDEMVNIMFWLEGYYTEDDDPTIIDFDKFTQALEQILIYCSNNPTVGMLTAADEAMGKESKGEK